MEMCSMNQNSVVRACFDNRRDAFGWKLRCSYGAYACIPALISLGCAQSKHPYK